MNKIIKVTGIVIGVTLLVFIISYVSIFAYVLGSLFYKLLDEQCCGNALKNMNFDGSSKWEKSQHGELKQSDPYIDYLVYRMELEYG